VSRLQAMAAFDLDQEARARFGGTNATLIFGRWR
jgi:hypothetical protein